MRAGTETWQASEHVAPNSFHHRAVDHHGARHGANQRYPGRWFDAALPALPDRPASMPVIFVHVSGPFGRVVQCRRYLPQSGHAWLEKPVNRGFLTRSNAVEKLMRCRDNTRRINRQMALATPENPGSEN